MNEELKEMLFQELGELKQHLAANQIKLAGKDAVIVELRWRLDKAGVMPL